MRVSLQWLRELVACDLPAGELGERLSMAGFELDGLEDLAAQAAGVVVGYVEQRDPHPNADKLSVCRVQIGAAEPLQIVCGAANVRAGIHVPVATVGAYLPAVDLTIKPAELRGVASSGMICSLKELGLADSSDGIAVLDELLELVPAVGSPVGPSLGLDDQVLELAITANRPDGLSLRGIAREVAALTGAALTLPPADPAIAAQPLPLGAEQLTAMEAGGLYSLTALTGIQVGPSPRWLQSRLERSGLRPINAVVDITNLVMLETGQPLHAFDAARLASLGQPNAHGPGAQISAIGLRQGTSEDAIRTLDGTDHPLSGEALVVTYADTPIALAGVMGGAASAVTDGTTDIWLEAAVFAPQAVRRSARSAGLRPAILPTSTTIIAPQAGWLQRRKRRMMASGSGSAAMRVTRVWISETVVSSPRVTWAISFSTSTRAGWPTSSFSWPRTAMMVSRRPPVSAQLVTSLYWPPSVGTKVPVNRPHESSPAGASLTESV